MNKYKDSTFDNTALTRLIITSNISFNKKQIMKILNLTNTQESVYQELIRLVKLVVDQIYNDAPLTEFPMTILKSISFQIADKFEEIFYTPIHKVASYTERSIIENLHDMQRKLQPTVVNCPRYNEMWIITYLIKAEYNKVSKSKAK
ncbi:unnamed protein product [Candida verbasci]|uniref:Uncharacterized protein n=1 Tax=Candida verbasci TaxID=1227364 RepID=A0A9W4TYT0_9ASCO|nr:unnamed protein product [Candida verbasci]